MSSFRLALRSLARRPGFVVVVVLTLALGIGANSAIFSVINAVLLKPLPYRAPNQLAMIWSKWANFDKTWLAEAEYLGYQGMKRVFEDVGTWGPGDDVTLGGSSAPESVIAIRMSANLLSVLGVAPAAGRSISEAEDIPNGPPVVMVGYDTWQRRYHGDLAILNRPIEINGESAIVVGVLPKAFRFPLEFQSRVTAQVVQPIQTNRSAPERGSHSQFAIGRLRSGVTATQAAAEVGALATRWNREGLYPADMRFGAFAVGLTDEIAGKVRVALAGLGAAVGLLLLLTCANVANLILIRADASSREIAVRSALGAGTREQLVLPLAESLLLGGAGGIAGLGLSWVALRVLVARAPTSVPRLAELDVGLPVVLFTVGLALLVGIVFGLVPIVKLRGMDLAQVLRDGARGLSGGAGRRRGRDVLVVAEMALAALLLAGATLTIRSFRNLQNVDPGFDPSGVLTFRLSLSPSRYPDSTSVVAFYQNLVDHARQLPGVKAAGVVRVLPLAAEIGDAGLAIEGKPTPANSNGMSADWQTVSPGYFEAMKIRLVSGRYFGAGDGSGGPPVIAINETLAREYFPGEDPIGHRIEVGGQTAVWRTVVAVVGDVHHDGITAPVKRAWFVPHAQWGKLIGGPRRDMTLVVRTTGAPRDALAPLQSYLRATDPGLALTQVATLDEVLAGATREQRFTTALMAGFALLALILAAVGVYGVVSYAVSQQTREIGIRLALGAGTGSVRAWVMKTSLAPAGVGLLLGLGLAALLAGFLRSILFGVAPLDPLTFALVGPSLAIVAAGSILIPAWRASRVEPIEALRAE